MPHSTAPKTILGVNLHSFYITDDSIYSSGAGSRHVADSTEYIKRPPFTASAVDDREHTTSSPFFSRLFLAGNHRPPSRSPHHQHLFVHTSAPIFSVNLRVNASFPHEKGLTCECVSV